MNTTQDYQRILTVFNRISESILDEASEREGLPRIVREATDVLDADAGTLAIPRENERELSIEAYYDGTQGRFEEVLASVETVKPGEGITGQAFTSREILEVTDEDTLDLSEETALENLAGRCSTILSVPLIVRSESVGVVNFYFGEPVNVRSQKEDLLKAVARQSGIAIRQGRKIRELRETNRRLRIRAATDALTGLPNQGRIMDVLNEELERSSRYSRPLSAMMLDVDRFKLVNDTHGHRAGDHVLEELAELFKDQTRKPDTVGRYGGEEFFFVLPETTEEDAYTLAERVRTSVENRVFEWEGNDLTVSVSCGLAERAPDMQLNEEKFLDRADRALLVAKREGRNRTVRFSRLATPAE